MRNSAHGPFAVPNNTTVIPEFATCGQFGGVCLEVIGNISAGNLAVTGSLYEGSSALRVQNVATGEETATITAAGLYWIAIPGIQNVKCSPSESFTGTGVQVYFSTSECIPPAPIPAA